MSDAGKRGGLNGNWLGQPHADDPQTVSAKQRDDLDLAAVKQLRSSINQIIDSISKIITKKSVVAQISAREFDRKKIIETLRELSKFVGQIMDEDTKITDGTLVFEHPVTVLVRELADALEGLDLGIVDARLRQARIGTPRYGKYKSNTIQLCLDFLYIYKNQKKVSWEISEKNVSKLLEKMGLKISDKVITAQNLSSWRRMPPSELLRSSK